MLTTGETKTTKIRTLSCAALVLLVLAGLLALRSLGAAPADRQVAEAAVKPEVEGAVVTVAVEAPDGLDGARVTRDEPSRRRDSSDTEDSTGTDPGDIHHVGDPVEPANASPLYSVVVTPEHPVAGDEVTVEISWSDAEADTIVAESWCRPSDGIHGGLCADDFISQQCPRPPGAVFAPKPGSGVLSFRFTPQAAGSYGWDWGVVLRSLPADLDGECTTYDPFQDEILVGGRIEVASTYEAPINPSIGWNPAVD